MVEMPTSKTLPRFSPSTAEGGEGGRRRRTGGVSPRDGSLSLCHAESREHPWPDQSRGGTPPVALTRATLPAQARWREKRAIAASVRFNLAPMLTDSIRQPAAATLPTPLARMSGDRKSTRLNSSYEWISYAVFCLKKKKKRIIGTRQPHAYRLNRDEMLF